MNFDNETLRRVSRDPVAALELGKAAEHFVCAHLILRGYRAYLSDQGLPYDVVVDDRGILIRIQVKSTCFARNMNAGGRAQRLGYTFYARRRGKKGASRLNRSECDIVALVAFDIFEVAFLPLSEVAQTCQFMPPGYSFRGKYKRTRGQSIDGFPFHAAIDRFRKEEALRCQ